MEELYLITATSEEDRETLINELSDYELVKKYSALKKVFSILITDEKAKELKEHSLVVDIEKRKKFNLTANTRPITSTGNWGLDRIDQRTLPLNGTYTFENTGRNVDVYVQDTGILSTHTEFGSRVTHLFAVSGLDYEDDHGHGTHCAGIIGGYTYGVAPAVNFFTVRCFNSSGDASNADLIDGFDAILYHHQHKSTGNPSVVNMSFTGSKTTLINNGVQELIDAGIICICAAGNYARPAANYSPASLDDIITVASSSNTDSLSTFSNASTEFTLSGGDVSNYGSSVDIIAPGQSIISAGISSNTSTATKSGTSMACPHVVGVVAQYLQSYPNATQSEVKAWLVDNATEDAITMTQIAITAGTPNKLLYSEFSAAPYVLSWITPEGSVGEYNEKEEMSFTFAATSSNGDVSRTVIYTLVTGDLPDGLTLNSAGILSGTPTDIVSSTTYSFVVRASDGNNYEDKNFSMTINIVNAAPIWSTSAGNIGSYKEGDVISIHLVANDPDNDVVTYTVEAGDLPNGVSLSSDGLISGTVGETSNGVYYNFTARASDPSGLYSLRKFNLYIETLYLPLTFITESGNIGEVTESNSFNFELVAQSRNANGTDRSITYSVVSGNLPNGISLSSSGILSGTAGTVDDDTTFYFTVEANDGLYTIQETFNIIILNQNNSPQWVTPQGLIGTYDEGETFTIQLEVYDLDDENIEFSLLNGSLPDGISIDSSGLISGTVGIIENSGSFYFTVRATDGNTFIDRRFILNINDINRSPEWVTDFTQSYDGYDFVGLLQEGDSFEYQFEATDPEDDDLTFGLTEGVLPDGLSLSPSGLLSGVVLPIYASSIEDSENSVSDESGYYNNKMYRFAIGVSDGTNVVSKKFQITVTDIPAGPLPVWLTSDDLGSYAEDSPIYTSVKASSFLIDSDDIYYTELANFGLPDGLYLNTNGVIYGSISNIQEDTEYTFRIVAHVDIRVVNTLNDLPTVSVALEENLYYVKVQETGEYYFNNSSTWEYIDIVSFTSVKEFKILILNRSTNTVPQWVTDNGLLGTLYVYDKSLLKIEATDDSDDDVMTYVLQDGELPPGLELHSSGIIMGTVKSNAIINKDYTFSVIAKNKYNSSDVRTFVINVERFYEDVEATGPIISAYIPITGYDNKNLNEDEKIPDEFLFRPLDDNYGRIKEKHMYVAGSLNYDSLSSFYNGLSTSTYYNQDWNDKANDSYWFTPNLEYYHPHVFIGEYAWKTITDDDGNELYDLVYRKVTDPQANVYYTGRVENGETQGEVVNQHPVDGIDISTTLEPQSIQNLREEMINIFGISNSERLPDIFNDEWELLLPIAYVNVGRGNDSVLILNSLGVLKPIKINIDRWLVYIQSETTWEGYLRPDDTKFDFINPTNDETSESYRTIHNKTRWDLDDKTGRFIKWYNDF